MAEHFGYTEVRSEPCTFTWRIDKFSMHVAREKEIISPVFESELHQLQWCLALNFRDHGQTVDLTLIRTKCDGNEQFLNFSLSIVDRFQLQLKRKTGCIVFDKDTERAKLGEMDLDYFTGCLCLLNKLCLLPNDTLTLRWEMVVSEDGAKLVYKSKEEYESRINTSKHSQAEIWEYYFPLLFLLCVLVGVLLVTGFRSTTALLSACLLLSLLCFKLRLLASAVPVVWDFLFLYLERLVSNHFSTKQNVD